MGIRSTLVGIILFTELLFLYLLVDLPLYISAISAHLVLQEQ